jgi:hypothetical protein
MNKFLEAVGGILLSFVLVGGAAALVVVSGAATGAETWKDIGLYALCIGGWFAGLGMIQLWYDWSNRKSRP